jgi:hypothetical protein
MPLRLLGELESPCFENDLHAHEQHDRVIIVMQHKAVFCVNINQFQQQHVQLFFVQNSSINSTFNSFLQVCESLTIFFMIVLCHLFHESLKCQLWDQCVRGLLILSDFSQSHCPGTISMWFLEISWCHHWECKDSTKPNKLSVLQIVFATVVGIENVKMNVYLWTQTLFLWSSS